MMKILDLLPGRKTYVVGLAMVLYGLAGWYSNAISSDTAITAIGAGLSALFVRRAVDR